MIYRQNWIPTGGLSEFLSYLPISPTIQKLNFLVCVTSGPETAQSYHSDIRGCGVQVCHAELSEAGEIAVPTEQRNISGHWPR